MVTAYNDQHVAPPVVNGATITHKALKSNPFKRQRMTGSSASGLKVKAAGF